MATSSQGSDRIAKIQRQIECTVKGKLLFSFSFFLFFPWPCRAVHSHAALSLYLSVKLYRAAMEQLRGKCGLDWGTPEGQDFMKSYDTILVLALGLH